VECVPGVASGGLVALRASDRNDFWIWFRGNGHCIHCSDIEVDRTGHRRSVGWQLWLICINSNPYLHSCIKIVCLGSRITAKVVPLANCCGRSFRLHQSSGATMLTTPIFGSFCFGNIMLGNPLIAQVHRIGLLLLPIFPLISFGHCSPLQCLLFHKRMPKFLIILKWT